MQKSYPGINKSISDWKGQDITDFQEELLMKVKAHISEKWFYNHIKSESKSLPRIDILNLLSKYVGYANWDEFVFKNSVQKSVEIKAPKGNRIFIIMPVLLILVMAALFLIFKIFSTREYRLNFYDAHTKENINGSKIEVQVLSDKESPENYLSDESGIIILKTDERVLKMVVSAPYYKTDTITRTLKNFDSDQKISLQADDYALIIHYFSVMNVDDWQKRRKYLGEIIDDGAIIYQVMNDARASGMEIYNKEEFINKLTMPTGSLKYIEILDTKLKDGKIMVLRFRINQKK
jgi:hypothetical protein